MNKRTVVRLGISLAMLGAFAGFLALLRTEEFGADPVAEPGLPVDLLRKIEVRNDQVKGKWIHAEGSLRTPFEIDALLQVPFMPPADYDLELLMEWKEGNEGIGIGLVIGGAQALAVLDSHGHKLSGLSLIDGKTVDENGTAREGRIFHKDVPVKVVCSVRGTQLKVTASGKPVFEWNGDPKKLSLRAPWTVRSRAALFLCSMNGTYEISRMLITPHGKGGRSLR